jgi:hypothetical protein
MPLQVALVTDTAQQPDVPVTMTTMVLPAPHVTMYFLEISYFLDCYAFVTCNNNGVCNSDGT